MHHMPALARLSEQLNQQTDVYTESLLELEKKLRKLNIGVEVWVDLAEVEKSGTAGHSESIIERLGYAKTSDGWGFAVKKTRIETGFFEGDTSCPWEEYFTVDDPAPLLKASRELRLKAAGKIDELLKALEARINDVLGDLGKATQTLQQG